MAFLDFLFQGSPPPSVTTYGTSTTGIPQWLSDYTQGLVTKANAVSGEPYQTYGGPRVAGFTPDQMSAFDMTRNSTGIWQPSFQSGQSAIQGAMGMSPTNAAQPYLQGAAGLVGGAAQVNPLAASAGYLNAAGEVNPLAMANGYTAAASGTFPQNYQSYMSPYQDAVVNRIGDVAARDLREKLLPEVNDQFTRAGQFGSSRQTEIVGRTLRDVADNTAGLQANVLNQGYQTAGNLFNQDASRMATLAGQQGQLGTNYMSALGSLGNIAGGQAQNYMSALGTLGGQMGNIGQVSGNLASSTQQNLGNLGYNAGVLGQIGQSAAMKDAAALEGIGTTQQNLTQQNLNTAYQDFLSQRQYPWDQLNNMSNIIRGLPTSSSSQTTSTAPGTTFSPSPLASIASSGLSALALANMFSGSK